MEENKKEYIVIIKSIKVKFTLLQSDLLIQETEVIVNAANNSLHLGGGVAGAILRGAGYSVQIECDKIMSQLKRSLPNGEVQITGIGKLNTNNLRNIFHAVGPVYYDGRRNEKADLTKTFKNILQQAYDLNYKSISIPPISSGIFGYPKKECANIFYEVIEEFLTHQIKQMKLDNNNKCCLEDIRMVIIDHPTFQVFKNEFIALSNKWANNEEFKEEIEFQ